MWEKGDVRKTWMLKNVGSGTYCTHVEWYSLLPCMTKKPIKLLSIKNLIQLNVLPLSQASSGILHYWWDPSGLHTNLPTYSRYLVQWKTKHIENCTLKERERVASVALRSLTQITGLDVDSPKRSQIRRALCISCVYLPLVVRRLEGDTDLCKCEFWLY